MGKPTTPTNEQVKEAVITYKTSADKARRDDAFTLIALSVESFITKATTKYFVRGSSGDDIRQVCLLSLVGIIETYDGEREFYNYATFVMRRKLFNFIKRSHLRRYKADNFSVSIDEDRGDGCDISQLLTAPVPSSFEDREAARQDVATIKGHLSEMELMVLNGMKHNVDASNNAHCSMYQGIVDYAEQFYGETLTIKQVDNVVSRIRRKAFKMERNGVLVSR